MINNVIAVVAAIVVANVKKDVNNEDF